MDVVDIVIGVNETVQPFVIGTWLSTIGIDAQFYESAATWILLPILCILFVSSVISAGKGFLPRVKIIIKAKSTTLRLFEKRDDVIFYGRKLMRKVKTMSSQDEDGRKGKKRKLILKFANKLLQRKTEILTLQLKELQQPEEFFEEDVISLDRTVTPDAFHMLQNIREFGHFDKAILLKLCDRTELLSIPAGTYLFNSGDYDKNVYLVESGKITIMLTGNYGYGNSLKILQTGDSITSFLSFVDVLLGHPKVYKTLSARAVEDSRVIQLPMATFQEILHEYPDHFIRFMQIIMVRLLRVTITTLRQHLGLGAEHIKSVPMNVHFKRNSARPPRHHVNVEQSDDANLIAEATAAFVKELNLVDASILSGNKVKVRKVRGGTYIMTEASGKKVALIYILSGSLVISQRKVGGETDVDLIPARAGEIIGGLAVLTGEPSYFSIRAKRLSKIATLSKSTVYGIVRRWPKVLLRIAHTVTRRLPTLVREVDFVLDWVFKDSGQAVYRDDDESDCVFIVLSGRLRSVITHANHKKELVGEYGKGSLVGIVELVTHSPRHTTVIAVRDSELAKLPEGLFNAIKLRFPIVLTRLINLLGHRILSTRHTPNTPLEPTVDRIAEHNFGTVAILAITDDVPLAAFTYELYHSANAIVPSLILTSTVIREILGSTIMEQHNDYRLTSWLATQEDSYQIFYQCDRSFSSWTQRCVRQADCIFVVGLGKNSPLVGKMETELERLVLRTRKELVLLYREDIERPRDTIVWLKLRPAISHHHHISCNSRIFAEIEQSEIDKLYSDILSSSPDVHSDFSRLARWITGTSIGLVLGGGGARGLSHIGIIRAMREKDIPIDLVGGVSIGSFVGALWCMERNVTTVTRISSEWAKRMTYFWYQLLDLTYPMLSIFTGRYFNNLIHTTFGEASIEDLWLPYFAVTTDISCITMRVHTKGSLWHYVRGSMSIAGLIPPLCDPIDGHYLIDGCYINNVPVDIMRSHGAAYTFAVDVGTQEEMNLTDYGDSLSGWWLLWKRFNPFSTPVRIPNIPDIQDRLAFVSHFQQLKMVRNSDRCTYIRPPVKKYKTLQFKSCAEICELGYAFGKAYFKHTRIGPLPYQKLQMDSQVSTKQGLSWKHRRFAPEYAFSQAAQMLCQDGPKIYIDKFHSKDEVEEEDDEDDDIYEAEEGAGSEVKSYASSRTDEQSQQGSLKLATL